MLNFLHNLTTSKKLQHLQTTNVNSQSVSENDNENEKEKEKMNCKLSPVIGEIKKNSSFRTKFFLQKSRWVLYEIKCKSNK